jgi:hypothetical protein
MASLKTLLAPAKVRRAAVVSSIARTHLDDEVVRRQRGFTTGPIVTRDDGTTHALDLRPWAMKGKAYATREIASIQASVATCAADGRIALLGVTIPRAPKAPRPPTLRVIDGRKTRVLDDAVPISFDSQSIDDVGFVGADIVILPSDSIYRAGAVRRPLVLRPKAKTFVEIDEVPAVKVAKFTKRDFPAFAIHGFARTGSGTDVLLWSDGGYTGRAYERTYHLGTLAPREITSAPGEGDSFFIANNEKVYEIRAGAKPSQRLVKAGRVLSITAGPTEANAPVVLASLIRTQAKHPIALAWWPVAREYARIPGALFGFPRADWFSQGHIGVCANLVWGFEPVSDDLRAIPWDAIAALPRTKE